MTKYVVLRGSEDGWKEVGTVDGSNDASAIRAAGPVSGGVFVAVPARSFRPRTVTVDVVEKVRLS